MRDSLINNIKRNDNIMSDLFDKRTDKTPGRATNKKAEKAAKRQAKSAEEKKAQKKTRIISISVISVFLLCTICAILLNSSFIRREFGVVNVGGIAFTAAEFDYFYFNAYEEYAQWVNQMEEEMGMEGFAESSLPDRSRPIREQMYNEEEGQTWADFIEENALSRMEYLVQVYHEAIANGFELSDDDRDNIYAEIDSMEMYAEMNMAPSLDAFLRQNYGAGMDAAVFERLYTFIMTASLYEASIVPEISFAPADLAEAYNEQRDQFDAFSVRLIEVLPDDESFEPSSTIARDLLSRVSTEEEFIEEARNYNPDNYYNDNSTLMSIQGGWLPEFIISWLADESRAYGDVEVLDDEAGEYSLVIFFRYRDDNDYLLVNMRQLTVMREDETMDDAARERAEEIKAAFIDGGATPQVMETLAMSGGEDEYLDGSLYTNIGRVTYESSSRGFMVMEEQPEIVEWLFAPERQIGDYELIRTEASGYHLVYFDGYGERLADIMAEDYLSENAAAEAMQEWRDALAPVEVTKSWLFPILTSI